MTEAINMIAGLTCIALVVAGISGLVIGLAELEWKLVAIGLATLLATPLVYIALTHYLAWAAHHAAT